MDIVERLKFDAARCEADYSKGIAKNIEEAIAEIERLRGSQERLKSAIEFAHSEGFQWPSDPMAEFVNGP